MNMTWQDELTRLRRFLRDPDAAIWSDAVLLRLFNDAQREFQHKAGTLQDFQVIRVPSLFQGSYLNEWEWPFTEHAMGYVYQAMHYYDQADVVYCYRWEVDVLAGITTDTQDEGEHYTHPWEAWYCSTHGEPPPVWAPERFERVRFLACDKDPIEASTLGEIQAGDRTWRTRSGEAQSYYRDEMLSNRLYIYPRPSTASWDDLTPGDTGMVLFTEDDTESSEYGTVISATGYTVSGEFGIVIDILDESDNLLMVYDIAPKDIETDSDSSAFPGFLTKYIEYGVLERAFSANTEGKSESLRDYWSYRKDVGLKAWKMFVSNRTSARSWVLQTQDPVPVRSRRQPRLPDTYPATW